jgi:hypothetical protein
MRTPADDPHGVLRALQESWRHEMEAAATYRLGLAFAIR